jgi:hypothetical protein
MSDHRPKVINFPCHLVELMLVLGGQAGLDLLTHKNKACTSSLPDLVKYLRFLVCLLVC